MPSIRPRIDPSEYARQKAEKAEKARLRREEIKRKQRGESIDEDAVPTRDFQEGKEDNSGADIGNNVQQNRRQHHQDHAHKHGEQNQNTTSSAHVVASFLNPPKNPEGCEFSPSYFEKNRQQFGNDEEFDRPSSCLAIHHNGIEGCVGSSDHALYTFQLSTGSGLRRLYSRHGGHTDWVSTVTYLPDGRVLSGGMDGKLCLWSRGGGAAASAEDLIGEQGSISKVTNVPLSPNCAASSGYDGSICLWDLSKHTAKLRKIQNERKALPPILNVAFSHDGKKLLSGTNNGLISLWDMGSEKVIKAAAGKHKSQVPYVVSHPSDDCLFFTASVDGTVALFDTRGPLGSVNNNEVGSTLCTKVFQKRDPRTGAMNSSVSDMKFVPNSDCILLSGGGGTLCMLDCRQGLQMIGEELEGHTCSCVSVSVDGVGETSFSGSQEGMVIAHNLKTLKPIYGMGANKKDANFLEVTNNKLVVSGGDGHCLIYDFCN